MRHQERFPRSLGIIDDLDLSSVCSAISNHFVHSTFNLKAPLRAIFYASDLV